MSQAEHEHRLTLTTEKIQAWREGAVSHTVFNNPERHNAVSVDMWDAVEEALADFAQANQARVLVLSGAGKKAFALRVGFVQEIAEDNQLQATVAVLATDIAGNAPLIVKAMKFSACQVLEADPLKRDLATGDSLVADCFASQDYVEGHQAFMEKRKPNFKGA